MKYKTGLWLTLVIFTIHNIEEYFTMSGFFLANSARIPSFAARFAKPINGELFVIMILLITVIAIALVYAGIKGGPNSNGMFWAMVWVSGGILANGVHHLVLTLYFAAYTPGVVTSVILFIPYSIYLIRKTLVEEQLDRKRLIWSFAAGAVLLVPTILAVRLLAAWLSLL